MYLTNEIAMYIQRHSKLPYIGQCQQREQCSQMSEFGWTIAYMASGAECEDGLCIVSIHDVSKYLAF
jgi:hypothetical protein